MKRQIVIEEHTTVHAELSTSQLRTSGRPRLIVRCTLGEQVVFGEASPLPGFGCDSLESARASLQVLSVDQIEAGAAWLVEQFRAHGACTVLADWLRLNEVFSTSSPAARFCWEMLCARRAAQLCDVSLFRLLGRDVAGRQLLTSQVLDPLAPELLEKARSFFAQGVATFKLKCGRSLNDEVQAIRLLSQALGDSLRLRIDVNRAFTAQQAHQLLGELRDLPIEWFEDITDDPAGWESLRAPGVRLAVDEALGDGDVEVARYADVLVVKPMALGGFSAGLKWRDWAEQAGKTICVSHLFDGALSLEATCALAFCIQSFPGAAGLSAHAGLWGEDISQQGASKFSWLMPERMIVPNSP